MKPKFIAIIVVYIYCIMPLLCLSQQKINGILVDADSKNTIPYANIFAGNLNTISWQDGSFSIELEKINPKDSLKVQCLGYETYTILLSDYVLINNQEIGLYQKTFSIAEVNVSAKKNRKNKIKKFGIYKRQSTGLGLINNMEQLALYIPNEKGYDGIIQNVQFYIRKAGIPNKEFRIHLYTVDSISKSPYKELLPKSVFASGTKGEEWVTVDISKFNIGFPSTGFFIAIEALPDRDADKIITKGTRKFLISNENIVLGLNWEKSNENLTWILAKPFENWRIDSSPYKNAVNNNAMIATEILILK